MGEHSTCPDDLAWLTDAMHALTQLRAVTSAQTQSFLVDATRLLLEQAIYLLQISRKDTLDPKRLPDALKQSLVAYSSCILDFHKQQTAGKIRKRSFMDIGEDSLEIISKFCSPKDSLSVLAVCKRFNRVYKKRIFEDVQICIGPDDEASYLSIGEGTRRMSFDNIPENFGSRLKFTERVDIYLQTPPSIHQRALLDTFEFRNVKVCHMDMWHEYEGEIPQFQDIMAWMEKLLCRSAESIESLKLTFWDDDFLLFSQSAPLENMLRTLTGLKQMGLDLHLYDHTPPKNAQVTNALQGFVNNLPADISSIKLVLDGRYVNSDLITFDGGMIPTDRITTLRAVGVSVKNISVARSFQNIKSLHLDKLVVDHPLSLSALMSSGFTARLEELHLAISPSWWEIREETLRSTPNMSRLKSLTLRVNLAEYRNWMTLLKQLFELAPNLEHVRFNFHVTSWGEEAFLESLLKLKPLNHLRGLFIGLTTSEPFFIFAESHTDFKSLLNKLAKRFPRLVELHSICPSVAFSQYWSSLCMDLRCSHFAERLRPVIAAKPHEENSHRTKRRRT
jgi:hypothetical protein